MPKYRVCVTVSQIESYRLEAESPREAAERWFDGNYCDHSESDFQEVVSVWEETGRCQERQVPYEEWEDLAAKKPYSVLLLYPDYAHDSNCETRYTFVEAKDQQDAVSIARSEAFTAIGDHETREPEDFALLLVIAGHHEDKPDLKTPE